MDYFVMKDGKLVKASLEEIMDPAVQLYTKDGEKVDRPETAVAAVETGTETETETDPPPVTAKSEEEDAVILKISETLDKMNAAIAGLGDEMTSMRKKVKAAEIKAQKAFPIGGDDEITAGKSDDAWKFVSGVYDVKRQGINLKRKYSWWNPKPETLKEMTQYFCLIACLADREPTQRKIKALELLDKTYKTVIGDTGNIFPIPDIVDEEILHFTRERSVILQNARMWDMTSEKQSFPIEGTAVTTNWGNTTQESEPGISEIELDAEELSSYSAVRNTTLADARSDIVSWLTEALAEAAGLELDNKGFNGLGSDSPFICSGILSADCGYSVTLGSGSTAFSQLSATDLSLMIAKLDGLRKEGARFWFNGIILHYIRSLKDNNGRPIFIETVGAPVSGTIWGYNYTEVIKCPSTSASNTAFAAFGNMRYFMVGRRLQVSTLDVDPYGLWTTNRTRFKLYNRWALRMGLKNGFVRLLTNS